MKITTVNATKILLFTSLMSQSCPSWGFVPGMGLWKFISTILGRPLGAAQTHWWFPAMKRWWGSHTSHSHGPTSSSPAYPLHWPIRCSRSSGVIFCHFDWGSVNAGISPPITWTQTPKLCKARVFQCSQTEAIANKSDCSKQISV